MKQKKALITGITGQTGSYLAEILLQKGYEVHGTVRYKSSEAMPNIDHIKNLLTIHTVDMHDFSSVSRIVFDNEYDEIYNLAAASHVKVSFDNPVACSRDAESVLTILEAMRHLKGRGEKVARFYQASTSEMFGKVHESPQTEETPFYPRSPYGCAKVFAHELVRNYREAHNFFACCGISFNHESPRRGETFVTRKIILGACNVKKGKQKKLYLGNLDARRDWSHAKDVARAIYMMLQANKPKDFVISSGETRSVRDFCDIAFSQLDLSYRDHVEIDPKFFRPTEVELLLGDCTKIREELGWEPEYSFKDLVSEMIENDMR